MRSDAYGLSAQAYGARYGTSNLGLPLANMIASRLGVELTNYKGSLGFWRQEGLTDAAGVWLRFLSFQSQKEGNFIFHFQGFSKEHYKGSGWIATNGKSLDNVLSVLTNFTNDGGTVKNIAFVGHGSKNEIWFGSDVLSKYDLNTNSADAQKFFKILSKITPQGSVALIVCNAALSKGGTIKHFLKRTDINVYMNNDISSVDRGVGVPFNEGLTRKANIVRGWVNLTSSETYYNMTITTGGTIAPIPFQ